VQASSTHSVLVGGRRTTPANPGNTNVNRLLQRGITSVTLPSTVSHVVCIGLCGRLWAGKAALNMGTRPC